MILNKDVFDKFVQSIKKSDFIDRSIVDRIFEQTPHEFHELDGVDFCTQDFANSLSFVNDIADSLDDDLINSDFYITATPSCFYSMLLNDVKIPTKSEIHDSKGYLHLCSLDLDSEHPDYKIGAYFLAFMNMDISKNILLCEDICTYIELNLPCIRVNRNMKINAYFKRAVLDKFQTDLDIISISNQQKYKSCVVSVLTYKSANSKTSNDCSRMDNLQYYCISQQMRFEFFKILVPLLSNCFIRINKIKNIIEPSGNFPVKFLLPSDTTISVGYTLQQCFDYLIDYGLMISHSDLESRIEFAESNNIRPCINDNNEHISSCKNTFYSLMFRLFDNSLVNQIEDIDKNILQGDYSAAEKTIFTTLIAS